MCLGTVNPYLTLGWRTDVSRHSKSIFNTRLEIDAGCVCSNSQQTSEIPVFHSMGFRLGNFQIL
jgi:hypothetical protein